MATGRGKCKVKPTKTGLCYRTFQKSVQCFIISNNASI